MTVFRRDDEQDEAYRKTMRGGWGFLLVCGAILVLAWWLW